MDAYGCMLSKRDLRSFADRPIADATLRKILNAGRMSGSSRNRQPWHFVVVRARDRLQRLATFGRFGQHVATAAVAIAVAIDDAAHGFDAGRCAQNMMLAAWNAGIASCPATMHRETDAKTLLGIPPARALVTVLSFGYPDPRGRGPVERAALRVLTGRGRRPLSTMVSWERFGLPARDRRL